MSRKDTILIAVIINAGLLAILFATAIIYDTDKLIDHSEFDTSLAEASPIKIERSLQYAAQTSSDIDDIDQEIQNFVEPMPVTIIEEEELFFPSTPMQEVKVIPQIQNKAEIQADYLEVSVKKGDSLDKIAKANRTTIEAIKRANNLTSERLSIGQLLKIPTKNETTRVQTTPVVPVQKQPVSTVQNVTLSSSPEAVYHVVKSGDSPWKIAKLYGVNYEQILKLNHLDEDKARNLKIGDRIRVK